MLRKPRELLQLGKGPAENLQNTWNSQDYTPDKVPIGWFTLKGKKQGNVSFALKKESGSRQSLHAKSAVKHFAQFFALKTTIPSFI